MPRTYGFKALMFGLKEIYRRETSDFLQVLSEASYRSVLDQIDLKSEDFNTQNFLPGSTGQAELKQWFRDVLGK